MQTLFDGIIYIYTEAAVARRCYVKKLFVNMSQNLQRNTCAGVSFLIKLRAWALRLQQRYLPVNFAKFLITLFFYRTPPMAASFYKLLCGIYTYGTIRQTGITCKKITL